MNEEEKSLLREKRHKKGKLYKNKLQKIFKEEVHLLLAMYPELMDPVEYFQVIIGNKVYYISYVPIEQVKFKDMLRKIYETYWYDIFDKYINFAAMSRYLPIREKENKK